MEGGFFDVLDDEEAILAKVQEESLRFYQEVEVPRLQIEKELINEDKPETISSNELAKPSCSRNQNKQEEALFYEGEEAFGFHLAAGFTYVYPTNYPVRVYQSSITRTALFKNTLVSLPTGLGKTFIAAVVMYNYYRWYPKGKIVFTAPTRPLVAQQIKACHQIMNIPVKDTVEMTGMINAEQRRLLWMEKRVFYLTPQVMVNDLKSNLCPAELIKCVVFDEAHRAMKDYAYCQVVKLLQASGCYYRTLALSATPGSDINAVQQVIRNLNISALEIRGEDALDVAPYTHTKFIEKIVVELSPNILRVREDFLQIYDKYARRLKEYKALTSNISFLTKFQMLKACERFRSNPPRGINPTTLGSLICDFTVCISLAHSLELLQAYGLRAFHSYLTNDGGEKSKTATNRLRNDGDLQKMLTQLGEILYPKPENHAPYTWGHPKLQRLVATVTEHFNNFEQNEPTKAIIFCQYRIVVNEIVDILQKCSIIKPAIFIGQSGGKEKGMSQIKQLQIMKDFREGRLNCLVATCVAEEGLDIGEVDLIVLMETHKSPVRLVQRLGRTGRKRKGRCVILLTNGKELEKFHTVMAARKNYVNTIINSDVVKSNLSKTSPSMIPHDITPQQQLVHINAVNLVTPTKQMKSKQIDIRNCFEPQISPFLTVDQIKELNSTYGDLNLNLDRLPKPVEMWSELRTSKKISIEELLNGNVSKLSCWNDWNLEKQQSFLVSHTNETELLCHLLHLSRNTKELNSLYEDMENEEEKLIEEKNGNQKEEKCKENLKLNMLEDKEIVEEKIVEHTAGKKSKKNRPDKVKSTGKILDIRSCMALAATKVKFAKMSSEVIEIPDDPLPQIKHCLQQSSSIILDDIMRLLELNSKQIEVINSEKYLLDCPIVGDNKLYSRLKKYMIPIGFNVNYYSIIPKTVLPDIDEVTKTLGNLLNESDKSLKNSQKPLSDFQNSPKERKNISGDFNDLVNLDDLFSDGSNFEVNFVETENKSSLQNFEVIDCSPKKENTANNDIMGINKTSNNTSTPSKNSSPFKEQNVKIYDCSKNSQELKKYDFDTSKFVCSTPLQLKKKDYNQDKHCLSKINEAAEEEEDGVWNLSDLFDYSDQEVNIDNNIMKNNDKSKVKSFEEGSNQKKLIQIVGSISVDKSMKEEPKEITNTSSLGQLDKISAESNGVNQNNISKVNSENDGMGSVYSGYKKSKFSEFNDSIDSTLSEFNFNSHKRETFGTSRPNFKIFKRKENLKKNNSTDGKTVSKELLQTKNTVININKMDEHNGLGSNKTEVCNNINTSNTTIQVCSSGKIENKICRNYSDNCKPTQKSSVSRKLIVESDEDDVFELSSSVRKRKIYLNSSFHKFSSPSPIKKSTKKRKIRTDVGFIENEAEVSGRLSTDDSDNSSLDDLDDSFINDENHSINDTHLEYLRSVRSPRNGGKFKIPVGGQIPNNIDILSQQIEQDNTTYLNDSFCVNSSAESGSSSISQLELAELILEEERRRNRGKKKNLNKKKKRCRIIESPVSEVDQLTKVGNNNSSGEGLLLENNYTWDKNRKRRRIIQSESEGESPLKKCDNNY